MTNPDVVTDPGCLVAETDAGEPAGRPEQYAAWQPFIETSSRLQTLIDEDLRASGGMSLMEYHLLLLLINAPQGRIRMRDLAKQMIFSSARLSYQIDVLTRRGWVCRKPVEEDRRGSYAAITDEGREAFHAAVEPHIRSVDRLFLEALGPEDGRHLAAVMHRLAAHLDRVEGSA